MQSRYQIPKQNFGEILNANLVIPRDINKDLMMSTQKTSVVKILSKKFSPKQPQTLVNDSLNLPQIQKY